ncbi:MAG: hypothetical protein JW782_02235 [Candidatus Saganbacteria bacterium]|nr:hypothetical protein [Candidatus Saganbacteria bacterium]
MAITDKDVNKLKEVFATKEDLKNFATKQDLEKLKDVFATKEEFRELKGEVTRLQGDVSVLGDMVRTGFDKVMGELGKIREDRVIATAKDREQDRRLDKLEAKVGA